MHSVGEIWTRSKPNSDLGMKIRQFEFIFSGGNGMRVFAAVLLSMGLAASPLLARNADETAKEETSAVVKSPSAVPDKPIPVKAESSAIESEMQDLRALVEEQRAELEEQRAALKAAETKMKELEERMSPVPA